jgi:hypothetical protein
MHNRRIMKTKIEIAAIAGIAAETASTDSRSNNSARISRKHL